MEKKLAWLAVLALCTGGVALAADEGTATYDLDPVVVTATRTEKNALETNANVSVMTARTIETRHYKDLNEVLRDMPGVTVTTHGGVGFERSDKVYINGSDAVLVLIDGTRANLNGSTFSPFNFGSLKDLSNIERIEVVKGSASTLYGSDAKGGVINIITKKASAQPQTNVGLEFGSYGREQYHLSTSGKAGKVGYSFGLRKDITGDYKDAKGVNWPSHSNTFSWNAKISAELSQRSDLTFAVDRYTGHYRYQNFSYGQKVIQEGSAADLNLRMNWDYRFNDRVKNKLSIYDHQSLTDYADWMMDLETIGVSDQVTAKIGQNNELVGGFDFYQEKMKDYDDGYGKFSDLSVTTKALYVQDRWDVTKKFNLTGGLRYTHHSKSGSNTSFAFTAGYDPTEKTNLYVSYKQYFLAPNMYQFYSPYGSEDLKAETGYTYEFGVSHKFDDTFNLQFHIFRRKSKDTIAYNYDTCKYDNLDRETSTGWDVRLNKAFTKELTMSVGYTHTKVKSEPAIGSAYYNRLIPNGEWHIGLNYDDHKAWAASITGRGVVGRLGNQEKMFPRGTYWIWDAAVNYTFKPNIRLFVKANNIFNQYYAEMSDVGSFGSLPGQWYAAPGRNFVVGVDYTF